MVKQANSVLEGVVVNAAGRPVCDATVMIETSDEPHPDIAALTDELGVFRFGDLLPGNYTVVAYGPDGSSGSATGQVDAGGTKKLRLQLGQA